MARVGSGGNLRSDTFQYREADLDFISRLLAEDGIACRVDEHPSGLVSLHQQRIRQEEAAETDVEE